MAPSMQGPNIFDDATRSPTKPSVFRSILSPKTHRRNHSADEAFSSGVSHKSQPSGDSFVSPVDQAYATLEQHPLAEIAPNRDAAEPGSTRQYSPDKHEKTGLHKKTKSAVSLKSLKSYMERRDHKTEESLEDESADLKPKKAKSANSLSAILKRSQRGRKGDGSRSTRDKENRSPTDLVDSMPSPVWGQFPTGSFHDVPEVPASANRRRTLQEEVSLYTPNRYGPTNQRNFHDYHQPSLTNRTEGKPRPKSDLLAGNRKTKEMFSPTQSMAPAKATPNDQPDPVPSKGRGRSRGLSKPGSRPETERKQEPSPKRVSRVQAAISAFNAKEQEAELQRKLNSRDLESEFEKLLVSIFHSARHFETENSRLTPSFRMRGTSLIT